MYLHVLPDKSISCLSSPWSPTNVSDGHKLGASGLGEVQSLTRGCALSNIAEAYPVPTGQLFVVNNIECSLLPPNIFYSASNYRSARAPTHSFNCIITVMMSSSSHSRASNMQSWSSEEDAPDDSYSHSHSHSSNSEGADATQQQPAPVTASSLPLHWHSWCALIVGDGFLGGRELGLPTDVRCQLLVRHVSGRPVWLSFIIDILRGREGEENGFGTFYYGEIFVNLDCCLS